MRSIHVNGFADDLCKTLPIVDAVAKVVTDECKPFLIQVNEAAYLGTGSSCLSKNQVGANGIQVDDDPYFGNGLIHTKELIGHDIHLSYKYGLTSFLIERPTEVEMTKLVTIELTSQIPWSPDGFPPTRFWARVNKGERGESIEQLAKEYGPRMGILNDRISQATMKCTTRMGSLDPRRPMRRHLKPRLPHMGLFRLNEDVSMDTVFPKKGKSNADFFGNTCWQQFCLHDSEYLFAVLMRREAAGPSALQDFIRYVGAPARLHSDRSKMQLSKQVAKICRNAFIPQSTTEAKHPWQNPCERQAQEVKKVAGIFMGQHNAPGKAWGMAVLHANYCLNRTAKQQLGLITSSEYAFGETPDISALQFEFFEEIIFLNPESHYPDSREEKGRFLGVAENVGDAFTFWVLNRKEQVIARSCVRKKDEDAPAIRDNVRQGGITNESEQERTFDVPGNIPESARTVYFDDEDNNDLGKQPDPAIEDEDEGALDEDEEIYFDRVNGDDEDLPEGYAEVDEVISHRRNRGRVEVLVKWKAGDETWEPLATIREDDPLSVAEYAKRKKLFKVRGFTWCDRFLRQTNGIIKGILRMAIARVYKSKRVMREMRQQGQRFKFGVELPRDVAHAYRLDEENGNNLWAEAIKKELEAFKIYKCFRFLKRGAKVPPRYTRVPLMMVFDVKQDGRRKARYVAGGHVTGPPIAEKYASVVKSENVRLTFLLAALNNLDLLMGDISNAYLNAFTSEKVFAIAGPEWGDKCG